jgi:choline transport protein
VPLLGIAVVTSIAALLGFVNLGSTTAFNDIISLTLEGLFTSYLVAVALLLYRRLRGEIGERADDQAWDSATLDEARCPRPNNRSHGALGGYQASGESSTTSSPAFTWS